MMAEDTSRRMALEPAGTARLHKLPSQQAMAPTHAMLVWQPLVTTSEKHNGKTFRNHCTEHDEVCIIATRLSEPQHLETDQFSI